MTEFPCIRCHLPVPREDGHLAWCNHCGAPQILLSEELQAELAEGARLYNQRSAPPPAATPAAADVSGRRPNLLRAVRAYTGQPAHPWTIGVPYALGAAAVTLVLGLLSLLLPPFSIFMLLWLLSAPALTVAFFNARFPAQPGSGFAARLGLLTGLLTAFCAAAVFTLSLLLTRFAFHDADLLDTQLAASFDQQRALVLARLGSSAQPTLDLFLIPEYRVGILLFVLATTAVLYLLLSTLAGLVAGLALRRRPTT